ncbi:MAG: tetratricopeptide repeat protein [Archangium sp.]|nr:tetratricopeptide repeat protein [Archangium sp.]
MSSPKKILAAALAALSITACQDPKPVPPVIPSKVITQPVARTVELRDAGAPISIAPVEAAPIDALAIATDSPNVDHLGRARQLSGEGDVKGALLEARRALFITPSDVETLTLVAKLSRRAGQAGLASEAWGRVAALSPDDALPLISQARALIQQKDYAGAVRSGREAIKRDSGNVESFQVTGIAQLALNELNGAIASFEKAVELEPNHGWALNNLGFACLRANQNERAVIVLEHAADVLPNVAYVQNNLGVALERVGRGDEAKAAYQHAMDLSPKYVKARINAARVAKVTQPQEEPQVDDTMSDLPHPMPEP